MHKIVMVFLVISSVVHASESPLDWSGTCLTPQEEQTRKVVLQIRAERDRLQEEKNKLEIQNQKLEAAIQALRQELQDAKKPYTSKQVEQ